MALIITALVYISLMIVLHTYRGYKTRQKNALELSKLDKMVKNNRQKNKTSYYKLQQERFTSKYANINMN